MLGRVLSGTKYGVRQARGKFGLGSKMALIWSKMSTGMPVEISSAQYDRKSEKGIKKSSYCKLDIDIRTHAVCLGLCLCLPLSLSDCVCVRACVRARVCACVCACVRACV